MRNLCPLYTYSGDAATYRKRLNALTTDDVAVVTSSNSGPTPATPELRARIAEVKERGVTPLGYVAVDYGRRSLGEVIIDIITWRRTYGVSRIFFDEWPSNWDAFHIGILFGAITRYVPPTASDPMVMCVNPGVRLSLPTHPPKGCYVVEHEGETAPTFKPSAWSVAIIYGQTNPKASRDALAASGWTYGYVTSDTLPNQYDEPSDG